MWTGNVRGAHEGSIKDARQHCYWHSFVSFTIKALPPPSPSSSPSSSAYSEETLWSDIVVGSTLKLAARSASFSLGRFHSRDSLLLFFSHLYFVSSCVSSTWRSGGWRRWTPAGQRVDPHPRTTTFISPRQSRTAAGLWTYRPTPRRFTATGLWLTLVGLCLETSKR